MKHTPQHAYNRLPADRDSRSGHEDPVDAELTPAEQEELGSRGADDTLGLYLRQMGSIPMLKRPAEIGSPASLSACEPLSLRGPA
jgi:hypothetical protein